MTIRHTHQTLVEHNDAYDISSNEWNADHTTEYPHTLGGETHYTSFDETGHQTMVGDARPWVDQLADAINLKQTGSGISTSATESVVEYTDAANLSDYAYVNVQLNHDRDESVAIKPHIHWFQASANVPNWLIQYRWQVNGATKTTGWTNLKCNTAAFSYSSGTIHQICGTAAGISPPVGSTISDIVQFRILRDTGNASTVFTGSDPYSGTVGMMAFDVHYQVNSIGSTDEYTK